MATAPVVKKGATPTSHVIGSIASETQATPAGQRQTETGTTNHPGYFSGGTGGVALTSSQNDAFAYVQQTLASYGLGSLAPWVKNEIIKGRTNNEILLDLRQTPEFQNRFPAIAIREKAGLPALSPGDYVSYENQATQLMRAAGLPKGFYDSPSDFTKLLAGDVSVSELNDRINMAKDATYQIPKETQSRLWSEFGLAPGSGELASFFIDPDKAVPLLQKQFTAAQIGGRADQTGFGGVTNDQAMQLAGNGVTDSQAQTGFANLAHSQQLLQTLPGETGPAISTDQALGATFLGNAADQQLIDQRRSERLGVFKDGGGFAATQRGEVGLGSAD